MKKVFLLILSLLTALSLVSCGGNKENATSSGQQPSSPSTPGQGGSTQGGSTQGGSEQGGNLVNTDILKPGIDMSKFELFDSSKHPAPTTVPAGMKFAGWYKTSIGRSVFEPQPLKDGDYILKNSQVYPYFIPENYLTYNWDKDSTNFNASIQSFYQVPLNPFTSKENAITNIIDLTELQPFRVVPNWRKAIKDGLARYVNDFSKFQDGSASFNNLDKLYILDGLASFPKDQKGNEYLNEYGEFDQLDAVNHTDTIWSYELRPGLKFYGTNTPIDATTYEFALQTALDPKQNNALGQRFYQDDKNTNGEPIKNTKAYYKGTLKDWSQVGFKVDPSNHLKFTIEFTKPVTQLTALGAISEFYIVDPSVYKKSMNDDGTKSSYGINADLFSNSGDFILKEFNNKSKIVLNKNFDSRLSYLTNYNSIVTTLVTDEAAKLTEFTNGNSTAISVTTENKDKLSPWQKTTVDLLGESARLLIFNLTKSTAKVDKVNSDPIIGNKDFRRAILFSINRQVMANGSGFPGQPVAIPVSNDDVQYLTNKTSYAKSQFHKDVLDQYHLSQDNPGYAPDQAKDLLAKAYQAMGYSADKTLHFVVVYPDGPLWKLTFQELQQSFDNVFGKGKIVLEGRALSGQASKEATKTYNWDFLLTGLSANTYYNIIWQLPTINFNGSNVGGTDLGINGPIDNYSSVVKDGVHYGDYTNDVFTVNLPNVYKYLASKIENQDSEYYNVDGTLKDTYAENLKLYNILKPTKGVNVKISYWDLMETIIENDESVFQPVSNYPITSGLEDEAYSITQIFDKLFFDYVPSSGLYTDAGKVAYKATVGNIWPAVSLRWDWGTGAYRFLTKSFYFKGFYNDDAKVAAQNILNAVAPSKVDLDIQLPEGFTVTSLDTNSAFVKDNKITTYVGNTVHLLFSSSSQAKVISQLTFNGQTYKPVAVNQFIFTVDNLGQITATSADRVFDLTNLPEGLTASAQQVKYNDPVTITIAVPQGATLYRLTLGSQDLTSQIKDNKVVIEHLTQEPLFLPIFVSEIQISDDWQPVQKSKLVKKDGKKYIRYNSIVAFTRTVPAADAAKYYSFTLNNETLPVVQDAPDTGSYVIPNYVYGDGSAEGKEVLKSASYTLVVKGKFDGVITVAESSKDVTAVQTMTAQDNFQVQYDTTDQLSVYEGTTTDGQEFDADKQGTVKFAVVGSQLKFTVQITPNFVIQSVSYNDAPIQATDNVYTVTVAAGTGIKVVVQETEGHKALVTALNGKFSSASTITASQRSIAGLVQGVYALLGDGASDKYDVSIQHPGNGHCTVVITDKQSKAFVSFDNVAYQFAQ